MLAFLRRPMSLRPLRPYRIGWYGDDGLGERLIQAVLDGRKTATAAPAYDPADGAVGELLSLVDKNGKVHGTLRITAIEHLPFSSFDETLASELGATLAEIRAMTSFANSRPIGPDEEMRVTRFELVR